VNGLSYRKLLEKEELKDCNEDTIVMEDLTIQTSDVIVKKENGGTFLKFKTKLWSIKSQFTSTFLIFLSLIR